jgi:hypothetical protein
MRESFTYGSVGRALREQCLYPEPDRENYAVYRKGLYRLESMMAGRLAQPNRAVNEWVRQHLRFSVPVYFFIT